MTYCLLSYHFARTQPSSHQPALIYLLAYYPLILPGLLLTYLPASTTADFTCSARVFVNVTTNAQPSKRSLLNASSIDIRKTKVTPLITDKELRFLRPAAVNWQELSSSPDTSIYNNVAWNSYCETTLFFLRRALTFMVLYVVRSSLNKKFFCAISFNS